jgi:general secretion pathway protein D
MVSQNGRGRSWPARGGALVVLALFVSACASAYRAGQREAEKGNWDMAVGKFTQALQKDPSNIKYKLSLENARIQASRFHFEEARKHMAAQDLDAAANSLEIAAKYDPANRSASDDLLLVKEKIRKRDEDKRRLADFEAMKARAQAQRVPVPVLSPRSPVPITLKFQDSSLEKIFDSLAKIAGVNILFDEGFRDKKVSVNLTGVTFQEALDQITFVNRLFYKVLDQNTLIIVPESPTKRRAYDETVLRTFYLQNADVNETLNMVKSLAKIQTAAGNPGLGAITVIGSLDAVALAERIIDANDKARGEVMIEVQILNVDRDKVKQYGLTLSNYGAGITYLPTGGGNPLGGEGSEANVTAPQAGFTNVRAHLLSSINLADFVVSIPAQLFARFFQSDAITKILASPRLRAAEGKKATLRIGQEVPVPVTTFQSTSTGPTSFTPATSFQYRNVGVNLDITPRVAASGDITLELNAEFSLPGAAASLGDQELPTFLTRNVTGTLRLRDGETSLIGGLLQRSESDSFSGIFGVQSIPILNKLFTNRNIQTRESEILISITPHIVRAPKLTDEDLTALGVGTVEVPRVPGARPSLFGPEVAPSPKPSPTPSPGVPPTVSPSTAPVTPLVPTPVPSPVPPPPPDVPPDAAPPSTVPPGATTTSPPVAATPPMGPAARPTAALFSPPEAALRVGQTGSLALVVMGAQDVQGVEVVFRYDPTLVEVVEVGAGSLLTLDGSAVSTEKELSAGRVRGRFSRATGATGSGAIATLTFRALRQGSGTVTLDSLVLARAQGTEHPAVANPGRIEVSP